MLNYNEMSKEMLIAHIQTMDMQLEAFTESEYQRRMRIVELEHQLQDHSAQSFSIGETYANALSRIAELEAQIAAKPADTDKLREAIAGISNNAITEAWESCGGVDGFYKSFGYQQFAHAVLDLAADTVCSTALQAPVREVPEVIYQMQHRSAKTVWTDIDAYAYQTAIAGGGAERVRKVSPLPAAPVQEPKP